MNILNNLDKKLKLETESNSSANFEIEAMLKLAPIDMPLDFIQLISEKNGLEISVDGEKVLRLWGAARCIELNEAYNFQKYISKGWAIGDDEGGNAILYIEENSEIRLYAVSFSDIDDKEKRYIASSLTDFLVKGIGISNFIDL